VTVWKASDIQRLIDGENKFDSQEFEVRVAQAPEENEEGRNLAGVPAKR
jgi:hypothetical protein